MEVRDVEPGDLEGVGRVHAVSRGRAYAGLVPAEALARVTPQPQTAVWRSRLAETAAPYLLVVAVEHQQVVGFAFGTGAGTVATVRALHLLPELHGSGAGQELHDRLLAGFRHRGCTTAELSVVEGNERAQCFYRRNGWRVDAWRGEHEIGGVVVPVLRYRRPV